MHLMKVYTDYWVLVDDVFIKKINSQYHPWLA